jgi:hypothetical protein
MEEKRKNALEMEEKKDEKREEKAKNESRKTLILSSIFISVYA